MATKRKTEQAFRVLSQCEENVSAIDALHRAASGAGEARLVEQVRGADLLRISFVATIGDWPGKLMGYVPITPAPVPTHACTWLVMLTLPAVDEAWRRTGVGASLARMGLDACRNLDIDAVSILGDPAYYARIGLTPGARNQLGVRRAGDVFGSWSGVSGRSAA